MTVVVSPEVRQRRLEHAAMLALLSGHPVAFKTAVESEKPAAMYYIQEACWEVFPARPAERPSPPLYIVPSP